MSLPNMKNVIAEAVSDYAVVPNRENLLVQRRYSRKKVREWLIGFPKLSDQKIESDFWDIVLGRFQIHIAGEHNINNTLKQLDEETPISPEALDSYLSTHPQAIRGNAEADLCPKHSAWTHDVSKLRDTVGMLLEPSTSVVYRMDQVLSGTYRIRGFGHATATTILMCWNDGKEEELNGPIYSKWTGHTERALDVFGIDFRGHTPGETYSNIWDLQRLMLEDLPVFQDLSDIDMFMFFADPRGLNMGKHRIRW